LAYCLAYEHIALAYANNIMYTIYSLISPQSEITISSVGVPLLQPIDQTQPDDYQAMVF
jgi:hypothetical protein